MMVGLDRCIGVVSHSLRRESSFMLATQLLQFRIVKNEIW